jgi:hypothetical protein
MLLSGGAMMFHWITKIATAVVPAFLLERFRKSNEAFRLYLSMRSKLDELANCWQEDRVWREWIPIFAEADEIIRRDSLDSLPSLRAIAENHLRHQQELISNQGG